MCVCELFSNQYIVQASALYWGPLCLYLGPLSTISATPASWTSTKAPLESWRPQLSNATLVEVQLSGVDEREGPVPSTKRAPVQS